MNNICLIANGHVFSTDNYKLYHCGRGSHKDLLFQIIFKSDKKIFLSLYTKDTLTLSPGKGVLMDQNNLNNIGRGSPKAYLYQIILKSGQLFVTKICL